MSLPQDYRLVAINNTGESISASTLTVTLQEFKGDGSGGVAHAAEVSNANAGSIADAGEEVITTITTSNNIGAIGTLTVDLSSGTGPSGDVLLYLELSTDGGSSFRRTQTPIALVNFEGTAEQRSTGFRL